MAKTIQIRNVPDEVHRTLTSRAALSGMSLSDYLIGQIRQIVDRPTADEMMRRIEERMPEIIRITNAKAVREGKKPGRR
jgi:plasmid stability protein